MNTQKIIVLTVEFTKNPLSTAPQLREGIIPGVTTATPESSCSLLLRRQLLDDGNLPRIPKTCILDLDTANNPYVHHTPPPLAPFLFYSA
jgi:hypothetical protein